MLSIIAALCENNAIGKNNKLLCPISDDLKRFKKLTYGKALLMGRKTFGSLPGVLPGRQHIVVTRNKGFHIDNCMVTAEHDLHGALERYAMSGDEVFVIGGAEIYAAALPFTKRLYLTVIEKFFDADSFFPCYTGEFKIIEESGMFYDIKNNAHYSYKTLERDITL